MCADKLNFEPQYAENCYARQRCVSSDVYMYSRRESFNHRRNRATIHVEEPRIFVFGLHDLGIFWHVFGWLFFFGFLLFIYMINKGRISFFFFSKISGVCDFWDGWFFGQGFRIANGVRILSFWQGFYKNFRKRNDF